MQHDWLTRLPGAVAQASGDSMVLPDAEMTYFPTFYPPAQSDCWRSTLQQEVAWQQDSLNFGGKRVPVPRLQAWYGDAGTDYGYSGLRLVPRDWTPLLLQLRADVQGRLDLAFNSVLLNWYRQGNDSMDWHADDEPELGSDPLIASLSFGVSRRFELKHRQRRELGKYSLELGNGSLLLMGRGMQRSWLHRIPKQPKVSGDRINLTFRLVRVRS